MKKSKKKKNKNIVQMLTVTRYTKEAWMRCYPESNEEEWAVVTQPLSLSEFVINTLGMLDQNDLDISSINKVKIITLDDDYFKYIADNDLEDDTVIRSNYKLPDDVALEKLKKYGLDKDYSLFVLPIFTTSESENLFVTDESKSKLRTYLESIFGAGSVYTTNWILKFEDILKNEDLLLSFADAYFSDGNNIIYELFKRQPKLKETTVRLLGLPIVIRKETMSAIVELEKLFDPKELKNYPNFVFFNKESFRDWNIRNVDDFEKTEVYAKLQKELEAITIFPNLLPASDMVKYYDQFVAALKEAADEEGKKVVVR